jgi:hypothetical protein
MRHACQGRLMLTCDVSGDVTGMSLEVRCEGC